MRIVVAAAIVFRDGKVLLTRRPAGTHLAGHWELPGGKLEEGEDPVDCVRRECLEECGIDVCVGEIADVTFHRYPDRDVLLLFYRCEWVRGEVRHLAISGHRWCDPAEIDDDDLPPADRKVAAKIRTGLSAA